uniref:Guanylyl cyclase n=1 Tax=Coccolithus braarudii TaxID=221442 RepID=A0A7S0LN83_9EUKA
MSRVSWCEKSVPSQPPPMRRRATKSDLKKIKQKVSRARRRGEEAWTDEEVDRAGLTLDDQPPRTLADLVTTKLVQTADWDCGLACVQMALSSLGLNEADVPTALLRSRLASKEVWSIDLAYLLADFGVQCEYWTAHASAADTHDGCAFYAKTIEEDTARVSALLAAAAEEGVCVRERVLTAAQLWNTLMDEEYALIALVDQPSLYAPLGESRTGDFMGHYVLLVGCDAARDSILLKDPGRREARTVLVKREIFEYARLVEGTDQDLIAVPLFQSTPASPEAGSLPKVERAIARAARMGGDGQGLPE